MHVQKVMYDLEGKLKKVQSDHDAYLVNVGLKEESHALEVQSLEAQINILQDQLSHTKEGHKGSEDEIRNLSRQVRDLNAAKKVVEASLNDFQVKAKDREDRVSPQSPSFFF